MKRIVFLFVATGFLFASTQSVVGLAEIKETLSRIIHEQEKIQSEYEELKKLQGDLNIYKDTRKKEDQKFKDNIKHINEELEKVTEALNENQKLFEEKQQKQINDFKKIIDQENRKIPEKIVNIVNKMKEQEQGKVREEEKIQDEKNKEKLINPKEFQDLKSKQIDQELDIKYSNEDKDYLIKRIRALELRILDLEQKSSQCACFLQDDEK